MKNILVIFCLLVSGLSFGQNNNEEIDFYQALWGMEKKDIVSQFVKVDPSVKDAFWNVYDEYEMERKANGKERIDLLTKYVNNYGTMSDEMIDQLMDDMISLGSKTDKLTASYYGKIKKVAGSKAAAQFLQLESYINSAIRTAIFEEIPFIGELGE